MLSRGRALDPFGGLSIGQRMLPAPHGREEKRELYGLYKSVSVGHFSYSTLICVAFISLISANESE